MGQGQKAKTSSLVRYYDMANLIESRGRTTGLEGYLPSAGKGVRCCRN